MTTENTTPETATEPEQPVVKKSDIVTMEFLEKRPLSYSSLKAFKKSPAHYVHYITEKRERTDAMLLGSVVDCLILTPDAFEKRFVVMPKFDRRTKDGKADYEKFLAANGGRECIPADMKQTADEMAGAVLTNPKSAEYIQMMTTTQRMLKWDDKATGLPMICFIDMDGKEPIDVMGDLKSTKDASPDQFERDAYNYGYHLQGASYLEACRRSMFRFPKYIIIAVESSAPYGVAVYDKISDSFFKLGLQELNELRQQFRHCLDNKLFDQSYNFKSVDGGLILDLPGYARNKIID